MFKDANRAVRLVSAALSEATFDREKLATGAEQGWITVTELADTLVRDYGVPFSAGHAIAARFVAACTTRPSAPRIEVLHAVTQEILGLAIEITEDQLARTLSARNFIDVRRTHGGPSPLVTGPAIAQSQAQLAADRKAVDAAAGRLTEAERNLTRAAQSL
jgi:argininosuccinate lyase